MKNKLDISFKFMLFSLLFFVLSKANINGIIYNSIDEFIGDLDGGESVTIAQGENTFPYLPDNGSSKLPSLNSIGGI